MSLDEKKAQAAAKAGAELAFYERMRDAPPHPGNTPCGHAYPHPECSKEKHALIRDGLPTDTEELRRVRREAMAPRGHCRCCGVELLSFKERHIVTIPKDVLGLSASPSHYEAEGFDLWLVDGRGRHWQGRVSCAVLIAQLLNGIGK